MSLRSKLQSALRRLDNALEPTERDAAIAEAKQRAADVLAKAKAEANAVLAETRAQYDEQSPAVKAKLANRLRKLAEKIDA